MTAQYLLPDGLDRDGLPALLQGALELTAEPGRTSERTYYETFDGRLHEAGLALVHEAGRLSLLEMQSGSERAGTAAAEAPARVLSTAIPAGRLRDRLSKVIEMRAATPTARLASHATRLRVLDDEAKTVVFLTVEEPAVLAASGARLRLRPRLDVSAVRGYEGWLERVRGSLEDGLGLVAVSEPLVEEAILRAGGTPGGFSSKPAIELVPGERADRAAARVLARLLVIMEANLPGTLADVDTEFLHDLRVSVRRTRAMQRELKGVFPPPPLAAFRAGFRWLQQVTGPTRDLDVQLLELEVGPDLEPLREVLARRRSDEYWRMILELESPRAKTLLAGWRQFVDNLEDARTEDRRDALRPVEEVAGRRIGKVYKRMVRMGRAIESDSPHEALHDLRKKGKELRYLLEFFSSLYPDEVIQPTVKRLKGLQDTLGRFQDREVQIALMRSLGEEVAPLEGGPDALIALGELVHNLQDERAQAREEFGERFAAFADSDQRKVMRDTFG